MVDCSARLRTHVADILNSQPTNVYCTTTNDKRWPYPDTLISENMVSFADSPFKFLLLPHRTFYIPEGIAYSASKTASIAAEQRALLVFPARNSI